MNSEKLQKARNALKIHSSGFPEKKWRIMWDRNLLMYSVVSEDYLNEFNPNYLAVTDINIPICSDD